VDYNAFIVVLEGDGWIGDGLSEVEIAAGAAPLRALLHAGRPLREPAMARGPLVMNTEEQIRQAMPMIAPRRRS
jgi:redox-sensitive bicupin YhaK (pirin superfamily)